MYSIENYPSINSTRNKSKYKSITILMAICMSITQRGTGIYDSGAERTVQN